MQTPFHKPLNEDFAALFPGGVAAIEASHLSPLLAEYQRAIANQLPAAELQAWSARLPGSVMSMTGKPYEMRPGGVAVISWSGLMVQRPGILARIFLGAVCSVELAEAVEAANRDDEVRSIMLKVSSPGGSVHGTSELADAVSEAASRKPVVTVCDGLVCSAAYWAASASGSIYITGPNVMVGSIGVVATHNYTPPSDGSVTTEIASGQFKRLGSPARPLSDQDRAHLQEKIDYMADHFFNAVAANRRLSPAAVKAQEARVYIGQQAIKAGLVDGVMSFNSLESQLASGPEKFTRRNPSRSVPSAVTPLLVVSQSATPGLQAALGTPALVPQVVASSKAAESGMSELDMRAEAAELVRKHRASTGKWPRVMSWGEWERLGKLRASKDGCSVVEGIKREGYIHPYASQTDPGARGAPGAKPTLELSKKQLAERAAAWSQFKGTSVLEALNYLGVH